MHDEPELIVPDPESPFAAPAPVAGPAPGEPSVAAAASFDGATGRGRAIRAGIVAGGALVVVLGAAVALGASPAPSAPNGTSGTSGAAGRDYVPGPGFVQGGPDLGLGRDKLGGVGHERRGSIFGPITVTAIDGNAVSLKTADGWTRTVQVTSSTTITKAGAAATLADLAVGDAVALGQTRNDDGTFTLNRIEIIVPSVAGTVTAVGTDTITITTKGGASQTIRTTGATTYHLGRGDGTRSDVKVGSVIVASGERGLDGTLIADRVAIRLPAVVGTVTAKTADTITLRRRDGTTITIHVGSGTAFRVAGKDAATLADVSVGMVVGVTGTQRADGSLDATDVHGGGKLDRVKGDPNGPKASPSTSSSSSTG
jgi:hypothetical protein